MARWPRALNDTATIELMDWFDIGVAGDPQDLWRCTARDFARMTRSVSHA
jgi:hypothetical protein